MVRRSPWWTEGACAIQTLLVVMDACIDREEVLVFEHEHRVSGRKWVYGFGVWIRFSSCCFAAQQCFTVHALEVTGRERRHWYQEHRRF